MAVSSNMLPLGTPMPEFSLPDVVSGRRVSSMDHAGKPTLIAVICNHCPFVVHMKEELSGVARDLIARGVSVVAVCANDVEYSPDDSPERMKEDAAEFAYPFPYLFDESQQLAAALQAMCTPEFYLFDDGGKLVYRGRFDDSSPGNGKPVTGDELKTAADALLTGKPPLEEQWPSKGCSVKWKDGNVPEYFSGG